MKILIGVSHPKQVHMFKNLIYELSKKGHECHVLEVEKEFTSKLLNFFNIKSYKIGKNQKNILKKIFQIFVLTSRTMKISVKIKPDIFIGQALPHFAYTSFLLRRPYIIFEDTETSIYLQKIVNPFANTIITPDSFRNNLGDKQVRIRGGYELAYLRPKYFKPVDDIYHYLGINKGEKYVIIRFVSWKANHDIGHKGISDENKIKCVKSFFKYAKVFISSEAPLPVELEPFRFSISPELMHNAIYHSSLVYGESGTMTAEAAYLGKPSIFINDKGLGYTSELEKKFSLVFNYTENEGDQINSINKGMDILKNIDKYGFSNNHKKLLTETIDVNAFMVWFIVNYPESHIIMKNNPQYQYRFK